MQPPPSIVTTATHYALNADRCYQQYQSRWAKFNSDRETMNQTAEANFIEEKNTYILNISITLQWSSITRLWHADSRG